MSRGGGAVTLIREILTESSTLLDDDSLTDLGKSLNMIKNTKIGEKKKIEKKTFSQGGRSFAQQGHSPRYLTEICIQYLL